ncbi:MAG: sigma-54 dependent transcriptional regulator [Thermoanaerobaculia bacterium]
MTQGRLLLVEDDSGAANALAQYFERLGYEVRTVGSVTAANAALGQFEPDVAVLDYALPDGTALHLIPSLRDRALAVPVVVLTGHAEIDLAVECIKAGAEQFLTKPADFASLRAVVERALERRRSWRKDRASTTLRQRSDFDPFLGTSPAVRRLAEGAKVAAQSASPVLILGETGSGKGVLARWLHGQSPRANDAFVDLNCAGLSRELLESELFGHAKGAFTSAMQAKTGLLEVADRGTLFLDEIGELDVGMQPRLLKVLEDQTFRRVGEVQERKVDVRLLAATNLDLAQAVGAGSFRADLFYRVNTFTLRVPPLRERTEDLRLLSEHLLERLSSWTGRRARLAPEAVEAMARYSWPGNLRELRNVLERAMLVDSNATLTAASLGLPGERPEARAARAAAEEENLTLAEVERRHVDRMLELERGNVERAAKRLGVPRSTLYQMIRTFGLTPARYRQGA